MTRPDLPRPNLSDPFWQVWALRGPRAIGHTHTGIETMFQLADSRHFQDGSLAPTRVIAVTQPQMIPHLTQAIADYAQKDPSRYPTLKMTYSSDRRAMSLSSRGWVLNVQIRTPSEIAERGLIGVGWELVWADELKSILEVDDVMDAAQEKQVRCVITALPDSAHRHYLDDHMEDPLLARYEDLGEPQTQNSNILQNPGFLQNPGISFPTITASKGGLVFNTTPGTGTTYNITNPPANTLTTREVVKAILDAKERYRDEYRGWTR